jgi:hypothetical protein
MHHTRHLRHAFARPPTLLVKISPKGFLIDDELHDQLTGRITRVRLLRKLFEDDVLVCDSADGTRARNGTLCDDCRHPRCRPQLRVHLHDGRAVYILDLALTSAQNLFRIDDQAAAQDVPLDDWVLRLTVCDRDRWGEVRFERILERGA